MKLIYFFLGKCSEIDFNLDANLSEDTHLQIINNHTLRIEKLEYSIPKNFYGNNIVNVSAIVGRNGVGKSSILNLLGLQRTNLHSCYPDSEWLAVYEDEDEYYLEGFNASNIFTAVKKRSGFAAYRLKKIDNALYPDGFIQIKDDIQDKFFVIHKPDLSNDKNNFKSKGSHRNDDGNIGFKRNYLLISNVNFYEFITDNSNDFCSHLSNKFISFRSHSNLDDEKEFPFYQEIPRYLYRDIFPLSQPKIDKIQNQRQLFVINMLEEYIRNVVKNTFNSDSEIFLKEMFTSNTYQGDLLNYNAIKLHFFSLQEKMFDLLISNNDEIISHLKNIDWNHIITFIEEEVSLTFLREEDMLKDNITCRINLEHYSDAAYNFISACDTTDIPIIFTLPRMSSGELDLNNKIAGINKSIKLSLNENQGVRGFIIILDEYDEHLHPEWARRFLDYLLNYLLSAYSDYQFQLILSTHSPYLISDLLKQNVIKIEHDITNNRYISSKANRSFASNIYDIINDAFFLSQPIGEFALQKINSILLKINDKSSIKNKKDHIETYNIINIIDDDFIRKNLHDKLAEYHDFNTETELENLEMEIKLLTEKKNKILKQLENKK